MTPPLHEQIRAARIASGMTREEWAKAIGVSRPNSYRLEKKGYNCKIQVLKNICKINDQIICISKET